MVYCKHMLKPLKGVGSTHHVNERRRRRQLAHLILGICVTLIVIGGIIAAVIVWYLGKTRPAVEAQKPTTTTKVAVTSAPTVDENAPVGVAIQTVTSPITPGSNASISIRTRPKAACSIQVTYSLTGDKDKISHDGGLIPKNADEYGTVSWTWTVEKGRPIGSWPIEITCAYNTKWGYGKQMLEVVD